MIKALIILTALAANLIVVEYGRTHIDDAMEFYYFGVHWSARIALVYFLLAYMARPVAQAFGVGQKLVQYRRQIGLAAALSMSIHVTFIFLVWPTLVQTWHIAQLIFVVLFGGFTLFLMLLMALTSNNWAQARLGRKWKVLHANGMGWLWGTFVFDAFFGSVSALWTVTGAPFSPYKPVALVTLAIARGLREYLKANYRRNRAK